VTVSPMPRSMAREVLAVWVVLMRSNSLRKS
jgi:hypothetical protein